jgi:U3 small nucleolar RNA-associated protein 20
VLKLVEVLVSKYVLPVSDKGYGSSSKVLGSIMEFLLCVLDVPVIMEKISVVSPFYAPTFKLLGRRLEQDCAS